MSTRILVVEDDETLALGLKNDLVLEGYDVVVASDGIEACRLAADQPFDLVLLDVMLPGRDGFDVCRDLRSRHVQAPIILLTARAQESDKVIGLELGADDYVTKPFSPRELRARIKAHLRRADGRSAAVYRAGDLEIDTGRCELRRGGEAVPLSALEFRLLETFVRRRGKVLTRATLLDEVWGPGTNVTDRVVDTHVMKLRRKIEAGRAPRYLIGVRGMGYRFDG
ncbi:MAG TPA: response regulator transcription factor [Vicinamibacterales bacterium]|nr:response regulator transcription factor [Vicinamibacterales bacterium]